MPKLNKTDAVAVGFCLDESASMGSCLRETISGFNEYLKSLGKQKGKTTITLTLFSGVEPEPNFRIQYEGMKIGKVPELSETTYRPRGMTPLFDAIGSTINRLDDELEKGGDNPPQAIVVIQTDGQENHSREFSREDILKLITKREKAGWTFIFLGADMDDQQASAIAADFGLEDAALGYAGAASAVAFAGIASSTSHVRATRTGGNHTSSKLAATITRDEYQSKSKKKPVAKT